MRWKKITKKVIKEALEWADNIGIELTESQFLLLMLNNRELKEDWEEVGDIDTCFRERMLDAISDDCGVVCNGGNWPTYSQKSKISKEFEKEFKEKAKKKGYILKKNFGLDR